MKRIPSVYNFVPVGDKVVYPAWADHVSHDVPFQDGISGDLEIELHTQTPLMVCDPHSPKGPGKTLQFCKDHTGAHMIPGSSLRGMLRSVLEIATWSKLGPINDDTFGLRDLNVRHLYGNFMGDVQKTTTGRREPMPLVNAGWLYRYYDEEQDEYQYKIRPCHFAKVEYRYLDRLAKELKISNFDPNHKQSATAKYKKWGEHAMKNYTAPISVLLRQGEISSRAKVTRVSDYGEYKGGSHSEKKSGRLVFTGQPQKRKPGEKRKKHHDFFFYGVATDYDIKISPDQWRAFEMIHADGAEQHRDEIKPNEEWGFWKTRMKSYDDHVGPQAKSRADKHYQQVPVFFVVDRLEKNKTKPTLKSFGLAMMFRLAYDTSLHTARENTQKSFKLDRKDFAQVLFGYTGDEKNKKEEQRSLKGRVSIGMAKAAGHIQNRQEVKAVLSAPKPTFYPAYIQQGSSPGDGPAPQDRGRGWKWVAYMGTGSNYPPRLRGWKRYLARHQWDKKPVLPAKASERVMTCFRPIAEQSRFRFHIRLHNVRPIELGALLWCLDFGGIEEATHQLGMGKPLGYGRVRLKVGKHSLWINDDVFDGHNAEDLLGEEHLQACIDRFQGYMNHQTQSKWSKSLTIRELRACAMPHPSGRDPDHIRQPMIDHPKNRNEFQLLKKSGARLPLHGSDHKYSEALYEVTNQTIAVYQDATTWKPVELDKTSVSPGERNSNDGSTDSKSKDVAHHTKTEHVSFEKLTRVEGRLKDTKSTKRVRKNRDKQIKKKGEATSVKIPVAVLGDATKDERYKKLFFMSEEIQLKDEFWDKVKVLNAFPNVYLSLVWDGEVPRVVKVEFLDS